MFWTIFLIFPFVDNHGYTPKLDINFLKTLIMNPNNHPHILAMTHGLTNL
jgi:hypothetical protein